MVENGFRQQCKLPEQPDGGRQPLPPKEQALDDAKGGRGRHRCLATPCRHYHHETTHTLPPTTTAVAAIKAPTNFFSKPYPKPRFPVANRKRGSGIGHFDWQGNRNGTTSIAITTMQTDYTTWKSGSTAVVPEKEEETHLHTNDIGYTCDRWLSSCQRKFDVLMAPARNRRSTARSP